MCPFKFAINCTRFDDRLTQKTPPFVTLWICRNGPAFDLRFSCVAARAEGLQIGGVPRQFGMRANGFDVIDFKVVS